MRIATSQLVCPYRKVTFGLRLLPLHKMLMSKPNRPLSCVCMRLPTLARFNLRTSSILAVLARSIFFTTNPAMTSPRCAFSSSATDLRISRDSFSSFTARVSDTAPTSADNAGIQPRRRAPDAAGVGNQMSRNPSDARPKRESVCSPVRITASPPSSITSTALHSNELVEGNGVFLLVAVEQLGAYPRRCDLDQLDAVFA